MSSLVPHCDVLNMKIVWASDDELGGGEEAKSEHMNLIGKRKFSLTHTHTLFLLENVVKF